MSTAFSKRLSVHWGQHCTDNLEIYDGKKKKKEVKRQKNIKTAQTDSLWPWWSEVIVHVKVSLKLAPCSVIAGVVEG